MSQADATADARFGPQLLESLRLSMVDGVGPRIRRRLLDRFGSPEAVFSASLSELRAVEGVGPKLARSIAAARDEIDAQAELDVCRRLGMTILPEDDDAYPALLREIHDPPAMLFVRGQVKPTDGLAIGIVGTRHATPYGLRMAERLANTLSKAGLTIVSGLARGIDAAAHRGAINAGGRTLAVLASGLANIYPPEHDQLADEVIAHGALLSEAPSHAVPQGGMFPQRNRIISGLSMGVIVVEAGDRSGALITARNAMEQGREVFAVPGRADDRTSRGCHRLLRDGARLVETADDVLEELGPMFKPAVRDDGQVVRHPAELQLNEMELQVLAAIGGDPTPVDQIIAETKLPASQVLSILFVLEMRRLVRRPSGATVMRV